MNQTQVKMKRRKYDADFKAEVLKMVDNGQSIPELSKNLGISESIIYRWHHQDKPFTKVNQREKEGSIVALQVECDALTTRLQQTEQERDILDLQTCLSIGS
jgi:transposase